MKKKCCTCKKVLELSNFHLNKSTPDGHSRNCKNCKRIENKKNHQKNRQKNLEKQKAYYQLHKEQLREKQKVWNEKNIHKVRAIKVRYNKKNRSSINARERNNPEVYRKWEKENPQRVRELGAKSMRKSREALSDAYIKNLICKRNNLQRKEIPKYLVEAYREKIKTQRLIKHMSNLKF